MMTQKKNLENDCSGLTLDDLRSEVENTKVKNITKSEIQKFNLWIQ